MVSWREKLANGTIRCRITCASGNFRQYTPIHPDDLWTPVPIPEIGDIARGEFFAEFLAFVQSGAERARYRCVAQKTIEKCGAAMAFEAVYSVEFLSGK